MVTFMDESFKRKKGFVGRSLPRKILVLAPYENAWKPIEKKVDDHEYFFCSYYLIGQLPELIGQGLIDDYDVCLLLNSNELTTLYRDAIFVISQSLPLLACVDRNEELPCKLNHLVLDGVVLEDLTPEVLRQRVDYVIASRPVIGAGQTLQESNEYMSKAFQELKSSLTSIVGFVNRMQSKESAVFSERVEAGFETVRWSANYAIDIVDDVNQYIQIETKKDDAKITKCDVSSMIRTVIHTLQFVANRSATTIYYESSDEFVFFELFESCMKYALVNLLVEMIERCSEIVITNTSKLNSENAELHICFHGIRKPKRQVSNTIHGSINRAKDARATEVAFLPQKPYVGFPLVRRVIEMHEGSIQVDDSFDRVIEVNILIPSRRWV